MSYEVIKIAADKLTYREKMKLAQYLIQAAIKEEETLNPTERLVTSSNGHQNKAAETKKRSKRSGVDLVCKGKARKVKTRETSVFEKLYWRYVSISGRY